MDKTSGSFPMDKIPPGSITVGNFASRLAIVLGICAYEFGAPGKAIYAGKRAVKPVIPVKWETDENGQPAFTLVPDGNGNPQKVLVTAFHRDFTNMSLSSVGLDEFTYLRKEMTAQLKEFVKDEKELMSALMRSLSRDSIILLESPQDGNGALGTFKEALASGDTFLLWSLIKATHRQGTNANDKAAALSSLASLRQIGPHQNFVSEFNSLADQVSSSFVSQHPGYWRIDDVLTAFYLAGCDRKYFGPPILAWNATQGASGLATLASLQAYLQSYAQLTGQPPAAAAADPLALAAQTAVHAVTPGLPPHGSLACPDCYKKGFNSLINPHPKSRHTSKDQCPYLNRGRNGRSKDGSTAPTALAATALPTLDLASQLLDTQQKAANIATQLANMDTVNNKTNAYLSSPPLDCPHYYDNACSSHLTNNGHDIPNLIPLPRPIPMGGIGSSVRITHSGASSIVPSFCANSLFSPQSNVKLTSLGEIQRCGGSYHSSGRNKLVVLDDHQQVIDTSTMLPNGLYPVSGSLYCSSCTAYPATATTDLVPAAALPTLVSPVVPSTLPDSVASAPSDTALPAPDGPVSVDFVTAPQRARIQRAYELHCSSGVHASDDILCETIKYGGFSESNLTAADIRLMRRILGQCPGCALAKIKNKVMHPSDSLPPASVAGKVHCDIHRTTVRSPAGKTIGIRFYCEFSGDIGFISAKEDGKSINLFNAIVEFLTYRYTRHGHVVGLLVCDFDKAMLPVVHLLGALKPRPIILTLITPDQKEQSAEIMYQHLLGRIRAVSESAPFFFPPTLQFHQLQWVGDRSNALVTDKTSPSTPDILVTGRRREPHYKYPDAAFGSVWAIQLLEGQQKTVAANTGQSVSSVSNGTVGVLVGFSHHVPGDYNFLLSNGEVVSRRKMIPLQIIPFGWTPKPPNHPYMRSPSIFPARTLLPVDTSSIDNSHDSLPVLDFVAPPFDVLTVPTAPDSSPSDAVVPELVPTAIVTPLVPPVSVLPSPVPYDALPPDVALLPSLPPASGPTVYLPTRVLPARSTRTSHAYDHFASRGTTALLSCTCSHSSDSSCAFCQLVDIETAVDPRSYNLFADEFELSDAASFFAAADPVAYAAPLASPSDLCPVPSPVCQEIPLYKALNQFDYARLSALTSDELVKQQRIGSLSTTSYKTLSDLPIGSITVPAAVIYKIKADKRETCRIVARGNDKTYQRHTAALETFCSVASNSDKAFALSVMQSYCESRDEVIDIELFDIVGGFLRIPRPSGSLRLFLHLPPSLPHPLAGCYLEVHSALYGLQESNRLFYLSVGECLSAGGFRACSSSPCTFVLRESHNGKMCVVSTHVDDFRSLTNAAPHLSAYLRKCLTDRYGEVTNPNSGVYAGIEYSVLPNGGVRTTQNAYIARIANKVGVAHLPPVLTPALMDFFELSTSDSDVVLFPILDYQSLSGSLVQMIECRHEVKHLVSHICAQNHHPNVGDYKKAINILRYLLSTPDIGCIFKSSSTDICLHADAAFAIHSDGSSAGATILTHGPDNAPFYVYAKSQAITAGVAPDPMSAEYYSASLAVRMLSHFSQLSEELGFFPSGPALLHLDSKTAINLITAPEVTKKARHMKAKHHYIREAHDSKIIIPVYVSSPLLRCDSITKIFTPPNFKRGRDRLLNISAQFVS